MKAAILQRPFPFPVNHFLADYRSRLSWPWFFEQFSSLATVAVLGTLSWLLVRDFIFQSVIVSGSSMYPTLFDNSNYWLIRSSYLEHLPQRTDIIAAKDPQDGRSEEHTSELQSPMY